MFYKQIVNINKFKKKMNKKCLLKMFNKKET